MYYQSTWQHWEHESQKAVWECAWRRWRHDRNFEGGDAWQDQKGLCYEIGCVHQDQGWWHDQGKWWSWNINFKFHNKLHDVLGSCAHADVGREARQKAHRACHQHEARRLFEHHVRRWRRCNGIHTSLHCIGGGDKTVFGERWVAAHREFGFKLEPQGPAAIVEQNDRMEFCSKVFVCVGLQTFLYPKPSKFFQSLRASQRVYNMT